MKLTPWLSMLFFPLAASAGTYEYGFLLISESSIGAGKGELIVRLDTATGNDFFCREKYKDSTEKDKTAWPACIAALGKATGTLKTTDWATTGALVFEPLTLSLFGRRGWEVVSVSVEEIKEGVYIKSTRYLLKSAGK